MKKLMTLLVLLLCVGNVFAQTGDVYSHQTGTIQPTGPRQPTGGDRYFNIEGSSNGQYASYGVARFNMAEVKTELDSHFGLSNWHITGITLSLTQDNSSFTTSGPVKVFYSSNDTIDIKSTSSPLVYPNTTQLGVNVSTDTPVLTYTFTEGSSGKIDNYSLTSAAQLYTDIYTGGTLTLVFYEGSASVAATYRGQESFSGRNPPEITVTAEAGGDNDCNGNEIDDALDILSGFSLDCNGNGTPDECELGENDCNGNGIPDECDIDSGFSEDCNGNGIPDECEVDCNGNGIPDDCDIVSGFSLDVNGNDIPDECDPDCNGNGIPDDWDISQGTSTDTNGNGIPDECDADCNGNGIVDELDILSGVSKDNNNNAVPDECETVCDPNNLPNMPRKVLAVLDATQSSWSNSQRCVAFYDVTHIQCVPLVKDKPMFYVWTGYEDGFSGNYEDPSALAVNPANGTVYLLAYDSGTPGVRDSAGDFEGDYDLYRINYQVILQDWLTRNPQTRMGTMYAPVYGPDHNYGGFAVVNPQHPSHVGTTVNIDNAIERIAEVARNQGTPFFDPDLDFVNPGRLCLLDNEKAGGDDPANDHSYYALNRTSLTGTGNTWEPTETWASSELGLVNMDYSGGSLVGRSEPEDIQYYRDPVTGIEGVWVQESDGGGDDIAFFQITNWTGTAGNAYRAYDYGTFPTSFALDNDPLVNPNSNDGSADIIQVDVNGNLIIGESGYFDSPQHEPRYILREVQNYDSTGRIDVGAWLDIDGDGVTNPLAVPYATDDSGPIDGRFSAYDKGANHMFIIDIDSGSAPNVTADLYVVDLSTNAYVQQTLNCLNHFTLPHGQEIFVRGDMDNDGDADAMDLSLLLEMVSGTPTDLQKEQYDLTGDNDLTCDDIAAMAAIIFVTSGDSDINGDGATDTEDLLIMAEKWLQNTFCSGYMGDLNGDGEVNLIDIALLSQSWLQ